MVGAIGFELEALSGRERVRVPGPHLRDGVEEREPAAEILSEAKDRQQEVWSGRSDLNR